MFGRIKSDKANEQCGFLARLRRETRGNTLAMVAAALIPIAAMIGGGVDMSRAYMAQSRLQSACDAASLAGRRVMRNNDLTTDVSAETLRFFNFNFEQGKYQTAAFTPDVSQPEPGVLRVTAETTIPTTIMSLFGFTTLPLEVSCDSSLNFVNTDVVLVLDVTGSMMCTPTEASCTRTGEIATSKIVALREAVMALYDELEPIQEELEANGQRLRFGIVPYSSSVNVGHLIRAVDPNYIAANTTYSARESLYTTPVVTGYTPNTPTTAARVSQTSGSLLTDGECTTWGNTNNGNEPALAGGPAPTPSTSTTYDRRDWGATGTRTGTRRTCRRWATVTTTTYSPITRFGFTSGTWSYRPSTLDTTALRTGNALTVASSLGSLTTAPGGTYATRETSLYRDEQEVVAAGAASTTVNWAGCIEERQTINTITGSSGYSIPSTAYDLQIDTIPSNDATRWRPFLPALIWRRDSPAITLSGTRDTTSSTSDAEYITSAARTSTGQPDPAHYACPTEARRLQAWTRETMNSYIDSLIAVGGTYHDIGMIWGARFISAGGIFADSPDTFNGQPVSRHIIYMTDGALAPNDFTYTSYGVENSDRRVTTDGDGNRPGSTQYNNHAQRFRMICNAAKNNDSSIWVIAFATALTADLTDCASNADQASLSANRQQLIARFRLIGNQIGALRLTE